MTKQSLGKTIAAVGVLLTLLILGRAFLYAPNNEIDSGLTLASSTLKSPGVGSTSTAGYPARLIIPKLDINTEVQHVGITKSGNMAAPNNFSDVSWYKYGAMPGHTGSAVMAGHEDNAIATPAIFYDLHKLEVGDTVEVVDHNHQRLKFKVVAKEIHPYNLKGAELEKIFNRNDKARLNLITCTGDWLPSAKTNDKRLIVYTELVS